MGTASIGCQARSASKKRVAPNSRVDSSKGAICAAAIRCAREPVGSGKETCSASSLRGAITLLTPTAWTLRRHEKKEPLTSQAGP